MVAPEGMVVAVLPTYNEKENIRPLVERFLGVRESLKPLDLRICFVDDSSPDGTADEIESVALTRPFVGVLKRSGKLGLGTAYMDGFRYSLERYDPVAFVQMDADLQHPPEKIPELVRAVLGGADLAIASRQVKGGGVRGWSRRRRLISWGANWLARSILGLPVRDLTTGFRALSRNAVKELLGAKLSASGFSYQVEVIKLLHDRQMRIVEIPFIFETRLFGKSKLSQSEIKQFLGTILRLRFGRKAS